MFGILKCEGDLGVVQSGVFPLVVDEACEDTREEEEERGEDDGGRDPRTETLLTRGEPPAQACAGLAVSAEVPEDSPALYLGSSATGLAAGSPLPF